MLGDPADTVGTTSDWCHVRDSEGDPRQDTFTVELEVASVLYKTNITHIAKRITVYPDLDGYFEMSLVETDNMDGTPKYVVRMYDQIFKINVPDGVEANFWDLVAASA
jgi:hypothetical protein